MNYIEKLVEKIVIEKLLYFYKINLKLHNSQIRAWKRKYAIDAAVIIVDNIHKIQEKKKIIALLLIDMKKTFNNIF